MQDFFEVIADKDDEINAYNGASYFDYSNYAFVSMETAEKLLVNYSDEGIERVDFFVSCLLYTSDAADDQ